jgi:UDP-glucose 4-epimerase
VRCLVTGASGHLGSFVTRRLVERGHDVMVMVRSQSSLWRIADVLADIRVVHGDLSRIDEAATEIIEAAPEVVFHLAWSGVAGVRRNHPDHVQVNVMGSLRLLELVGRAGCQSWVGIGSQAEFGPYDGILTEDVPTRPVTTYGTGKLCTGLLARELCAAWDMRYLWLRLLATYGPKEEPHHLIPSTILKLLAGERPALTNGEQRWDYLYVEDAAEAMCRAALDANAKGVFVLGSGEARTVREIVERIRHLIDPEALLGLGDVAYGPDQPMYLQADITRFRAATGWEPSVPFDVGLERTVDWYRAVAPRPVIAP